MQPVKPKILIAISFFHPYRGGAEQQALLLAAEMHQQGLPVAVLTRHFPGQPRQETVRGIPVHRAIYTLPWGKLFGISYFVSCLWFFIKNRRSFDILQCFILQGFHSLAAIVMKCFFKKMVVIRVSATGPLSDFLLLRRGLGGAFMLRCVRRADRIIVLSRRSEQEALDAGFLPHQLAHIPNGVDISVFSPPPQPPASGHILFVGRLDRMKGVDVLLEALAQLREMGIPCRCTIVGDGPAKKDLQRHAGSLGLDGMVVFTGTCSDISSRMQQAAIFVLPSHSEGTPNVLLEAMACGLPIVATEVGGIPDIIHSGSNGLLVPPADSAALCSALATLLNDREQAGDLGKKARRDAESCYSLHAAVTAYTELYAARETTGL